VNGWLYGTESLTQADALNRHWISAIGLAPLDLTAAKAVIATVFSGIVRLFSNFDDNRFITFRGGFPMPEPTIAQKSPYPVAVEAGKSYYWCACGRSAGQPFCDGSHKGSAFTPVKFEATESKTVFFCGCKHTATPVFCDGSHNKL
jgi:CDGSH-type Zn-finger protein